jgi:hypothetical protein
VILKAAAVGCSVVLAAGFVSYRAGAIEWFNPPAPEPAPVVETPGPATAPQPTEATSELAPPAILYSSKSGAIVPPPAPATGASIASPPPAFIGSSKSLAPLIPPASPKPATPPVQTPTPGK